MSKEKEQTYPHWTAEVLEKKDEGFGRYKMGVTEHYEDGTSKVIGTYDRNYSPMRTFFPFRKGEKILALYSTDYTATRVMEITPGEGIKDLGGEKRETWGFCPVEFYVPEVTGYEFEWHSCFQRFGAHEDYTFRRKVTWEEFKQSLPAGSVVIESDEPRDRKSSFRYFEGDTEIPEPTKTARIIYPCNVGFVAGCVWGDDSSWKIQYIDLSQAEQGIIKRDESKLGYVELPNKIHLADAIDADSLWDGNEFDGYCEIAIQAHVNLITGEYSSPIQGKLGEIQLENYEGRIWKHRLQQVLTDELGEEKALSIIDKLKEQKSGC